MSLPSRESLVFSTFYNISLNLPWNCSNRRQFSFLKFKHELPQKEQYTPPAYTPLYIPPQASPSCLLVQDRHLISTRPCSFNSKIKKMPTKILNALLYYVLCTNCLRSRSSAALQQQCALLTVYFPDEYKSTASKRGFFEWMWKHELNETQGVSILPDIADRRHRSTPSSRAPEHPGSGSQFSAILERVYERGCSPALNTVTIYRVLLPFQQQPQQPQLKEYSIQCSALI